MSDVFWLDKLPAVDFPTRDSLPDRCDVAIIGGGLAGVAIALFLAEKSAASVVLVESHSQMGMGCSGRGLGLVVEGLIEHPFRVVHALGKEDASALYRFSMESLAHLRDLAVVQTTGGLWASVDAREDEQLKDSEKALHEMGIDCELWNQTTTCAELSGIGFRQALYFPEHGLISPMEVVAELAGRAVQAGARVHVDCRVNEVVDGAEGHQIRIGESILMADIVVFAGGAQLVDLDPYFEDKLTPVRETALATEPVPSRFSLACRAQYAYTSWRQAPTGEILIGGCRWATPHMEVGETDDTVVSEAVQAKIHGFLCEHFQDLAPLQIRNRWSWIHANSCDGLPLIGPIPGSPRTLVCAGFNGNQTGLAVGAAKAISEGLTTGRADRVPGFLTLGRFL